MSKLDEHLQRLTEEGAVEGEGQFTVAKDQIWSRLEQSVTTGIKFGVELTRWLIFLGAQNIDFQEVKKVGQLYIQTEFVSPADLESALARILSQDFEFSGRDIELARAIVSARHLKLSALTLSFSLGGENYQCDLLRSTTLEPTDANLSSGLTLTVQRPMFAVSQFSEQKKILSHCLRHSPVPILWSGSRLSKPIDAFRGATVWRHLEPLDSESCLPRLKVEPPTDSLDFFRTRRHPQSEIFIALSSHDQSQVRIIYHGNGFTIDRPGFLKGFTIYLQASNLKLDLNGTEIIRDRQLHQLLDSLKSEAYDMVLQLYQLRSQLDPKRVAACYCGIESVLLNLLEDKSFEEGYLLTKWLENTWSELVETRWGLDTFTFAELCKLFATRSRHPKTAKRWTERARSVEDDLSKSVSDFRIQALLIRSRLDTRARRGEDPLMGHDSQNALHLGALRCQREGDHQNAARLFETLAAAFPKSSEEHWNHKASSANSAALSGDVPKARMIYQTIADWHQSQNQRLPRSISAQWANLSQ